MTLRFGQAGLSLVELMIAMVLGLVVLAALTSVFVNNSATRRELDNATEILMTGEYVLELLASELSQAGFYGSLAAATGTTAAPCATDIATWQGSLALHAQGSNQGDTTTAFGCVSGIRNVASSDAIFIQRASTCVAGPIPESGCDALAAGQVYLQVSECGDEYIATPFVLAKNAGTPFTLRRKAVAAVTCDAAGTAPIRTLVRSIYFVTPDRTLQRLDLSIDASANPPGTVTTLASGIENLQIEYGVDSSGDGSPDSFASAPAAANWVDVVGARIFVLVRAEQPSAGYVDDKAYLLGDVCSLPAGSTACPAPHAANTALMRAAADRAFKRHVFSTYVSFVNPTGRREQ